jgi:hypothetical protein
VGGEDIRKGHRGVNMWKYYMHMYEDGRMTPVETIPGTGGGGIKKNDRGGEFNSEIYCKNSGKCHNVPPVEK